MKNQRKSKGVRCDRCHITDENQNSLMGRWNDGECGTDNTKKTKKKTSSLLTNDQ
ncbi:hypothetical protein [Fortiea contorta]|uniref:hypothetical protein n=1 Tax=Fortiea contorta TaxID=1892405 RepID=UPI001EE667BA|nr:hypothetical protein [Fortiea contorta]